MRHRSAIVTSAFLAGFSLSALASAQTRSAETPAAPATADGPARTTVTQPVGTTPRPGAVQFFTVDQPAGARREVAQQTWPHRPLLITGSVLFLGSYGASTIVAAASDRKADEKLFIPVVGPWLDLKKRDCDVKACGGDVFNKVLIGSSGVLQGAGAFMVLLGLVVPQAKERPWYVVGDDKLSIAPQVGLSLTGLSARGRF
jgi:hypothetical protein